MATRTFTSAGINNLWSNPANWDGGTTIPADGDSVTIPSGQTCEFDIDTSAWANGIAGITVTGVLSMSTTVSTYLKMKAATTITGTGTFNAGTSANPIPFAVKCTITGGTAWKFAGANTLTVNLYGAEPTNNLVNFSDSEAKGQTVLSVDTDVTGDIWAVGDTVLITTVNAATYQTYTIASIAASEITLTGGLTVAKTTNDKIVLLTRNVQIIGNGANAFDQVTGSMSGAWITSPGQTVIYKGTWTMSDGIIAIGGHLVWQATFNLSGGIFAGAENYCMYLSTVHSDGSTWRTISNNYNLYSVRGEFDGLIISNCVNGFYSCAYLTISNVTIESTQYNLQAGCNGVIFLNSTCNGGFLNGGNSCQLVNSTFGTTYFTDSTAYNCSFGSTPAMLTNTPKYFYSESFDHNQVAGDYFGMNVGAYTYNQTSVLPTGYSDAFITTLRDANNEGFWRRRVSVAAGASVTIDMWLRKPASMTYLPRIIIYDVTVLDPLLGGTPLDTFTMTDSIDTWEHDTYTYTNETSKNKNLVIRVQGKAASGTFYSALNVDFINVDLTSALAKLDTIDTVVDSIKAKTDVLKNPTLLVGGEIIV